MVTVGEVILLPCPTPALNHKTLVAIRLQHSMQIGMLRCSGQGIELCWDGVRTRIAWKDRQRCCEQRPLESVSRRPAPIPLAQRQDLLQGGPVSHMCCKHTWLHSSFLICDRYFGPHVNIYSGQMQASSARRSSTVMLRFWSRQGRSCNRRGICNTCARA